MSERLGRCPSGLPERIAQVAELEGFSQKGAGAHVMGPSGQAEF